jgi:DNA-binding GntR family transcriptional regulator
MCSNGGGASASSAVMVASGDIYAPSAKADLRHRSHDRVARSWTKAIILCIPIRSNVARDRSGARILESDVNEPLGRTSLYLHDTVREELRKRISRGAYQPGASIPSTASLSGEFGVSPITIKRALRDLQAAGLLIAAAGRGTFVKEQRRFLLQLDAGISSWDDARVVPISITRERISDPAMSVFDPPKGAMLCVRKMIYFREELPIIYDTTYVSRDVADDIVDELGERLVSDALKRRGIKPVSTSAVIDAAPASGQAAEAFSVPSGYPMLRRLYNIETTKPGVNIFGILQSPFDRLACGLNLKSGPKSDRRAAHK